MIRLIASVFQKKHVVLWIIFAVAMFLRLIFLDSIPHELHEDEVTNAYVGRFILQNGRDLRGNILPLLYFDKFGDFPPVIPMYISGAATFLFGMTVFGARFSVAFFGALFVFPMYGIARYIFSDKKYAYCAAFIASVFPWHIILSRASSEGIIGLTVFCTGLGCLFHGLRTKEHRSIIFGMFLFLCTYLLYPAFRIAVPLFLLPFPVLFSDKGFRKLLIGGIFVAFCFTVLISTTVWGRGRFTQTSLFADTNIASEIQNRDEAFGNDEGPSDILLARIFHNKVVGYGREIVHQYLRYFSPQFLFFGYQLPLRYGVPESGLLFFTFIVFLVAALFPSLKKGVVEADMYRVMIVLLVLAPIPASLTLEDSPNIHRSILMILPIVILLTYGYARLHEFLETMPKFVRHGVYGAVGLGIVFESIIFFHQYTRHTASYKSFYRSDGNAALVRYLIAHKDEYDSIYMPPFHFLPIYYLYFSGNVNSSLAGKFYDTLYLRSLDNIHFIDEDCPSRYVKKEQLTSQSLVVDFAGCDTGLPFEQVTVFDRADKTRAFRLLRYQSQ